MFPGIACIDSTINKHANVDIVAKNINKRRVGSAPPVWNTFAVKGIVGPVIAFTRKQIDGKNAGINIENTYCFSSKQLVYCSSS